MDKFDELLQETVDHCIKHVMRAEPHEVLCDSDAYVDFIFSCAVNIAGNLILKISKDDAESRKITSNQFCENTRQWFDRVISKKFYLKEIH